MRILSAFFAVLFTFINPCMLYKVLSELESSFSHHMLEKMRLPVIESLRSYFFSNNPTSKLQLAIYLSVLLFTLAHLIFTGLALYGHYSCRPSLFLPFLFDVGFSLFILLLFLCFTVLMYFNLNSDKGTEEKDFLKTQLRNIYVASAFLMSYMAWLMVSIAAYIDTKKLHADFMYWIVEEKISMRSKVNASSERSDRSSKGSKVSRTSNRSNRSSRSNQSVKSDQPRPFSSSAETPYNTKISTADVRLSVPL